MQYIPAIDEYVAFEGHPIRARGTAQMPYYPSMEDEEITWEMEGYSEDENRAIAVWLANNFLQVANRIMEASINIKYRFNANISRN